MRDKSLLYSTKERKIRKLENTLLSAKIVLNVHVLKVRSL
jgi:hypothetical protein